MKILKKYWGLAIIFLLSLIILSPIFHSGSFPVHDDAQASRVYEMAQSLKDGMFPVRFVKDLGFGYGYPIFNFYSPLPYYIGSIFVLGGIDALLAAKIMMAIAVITAGFSMYFFLRSFLSEAAGVAGGVIYLFFPYFAVNIFVRGAVGESYAYALMPLVFLGFFRMYYILRKSDIFPIPWILFTGVVLALVVISHNLSAFMLGLVFIFLLFGALIFHPRKKKILFSYALAVFLAFLFSAFYTVPALLEMRFTDVVSQVSGGFAYANHFVCPLQLWYSPWGFAGSAPGCIDGMSFRLGKSNIIFAVIAIFLGIYTYKKRKEQNNQFLFGFSLFLLIFSLFMALPASGLIWKVVPGISFVQFPWRFLDFTGLSFAFLVGFLVFFTGRKKLQGILLIFIIAATLMLNAKLFVPQLNDTRTVFSYTSRKALTFTVSKLTNEYMPKGFIKPTTYFQVPKYPADIINGKGKITVLEDNTKNIAIHVVSSKSSLVRLNQAYFPAWNYTVNGKNVPYRVANDGIYFFLPPGISDIRAEFVGTTTEHIADAISIFGILVLIVGIIIYYEQKKS